jgi:hypothetical protein
MTKKTKYSNAGKGDKNRVSDKKKYDENYEKIWGSDIRGEFKPKIQWPIPLKLKPKWKEFSDETKKKKTEKKTTDK